MSLSCFGILYYVLVGMLCGGAAIQYSSGNIARACFFLIALGILLILNEIKRNARIVYNYNDCDFIAPPSDSIPHPGQSAPGSSGSADDGTERR